MEDKVIHILLVEDDEVDVMNVKRAFKKPYTLQTMALKHLLNYVATRIPVHLYHLQDGSFCSI